MSAKRKFYDRGLRVAIWACVGITMLLLAGLIGGILVRGLGHVTWELLSTQRSALKGTVGILPNILYTVYMILTTLLVALPLGIGAAIYLNEYAANRRMVAVVEFATETLAGIPSIIYGLVGMLLFVQTLGLGTSVLAGALTLTVMILPTIVRTTQEALKNVPNSYREGAIGLGASKWVTIRTIVLPCTLDGVVGGAILSIGKIVGESAALLYTAGTGYTLVSDYLDALHTSGGTLSVALYVFVSEQGKFDIGFAIAAILMILVFCINSGARLARRRLKRT